MPVGEREYEDSNGHTVIVTNYTALMQAIEKELCSVVARILSQKYFAQEIQSKDSEGNTLAHYAAQKSTSQMATVLKTLIKHGASVDATNCRGDKPLHVVCQTHTGQADATTEMIEVLLKHCDPWQKGSNGRLPLHMVFDADNMKQLGENSDPVSIVSCLAGAMSVKKPLAKAIAVAIVDNNKRTPLHCAARRNANICTMRMLKLFDASVVRFSNAESSLHFLSLSRSILKTLTTTQRSVLPRTPTING